MPWPAVKLGVLHGQFPRQNTAVVQGCVPFVRRISAWWRRRSIMAVAAMSSPKISPQLAVAIERRLHLPQPNHATTQEAATAATM
jgi:hypothetical protein